MKTQLHKMLLLVLISISGALTMNAQNIINDFNVDEEGWTASGSNSVTQSGSDLVAAFDGTSRFGLVSGPTILGLDAYTTVKVTISSISLNTTSPNFEPNRITLRPSGGAGVNISWTGTGTYEFDMSSVVDWTGNKAAEIQFRAAGDKNSRLLGTISIDKVEFVQTGTPPTPTVDVLDFNFNTNDDAENWDQLSNSTIKVENGVLAINGLLVNTFDVKNALNTINTDPDNTPDNGDEIKYCHITYKNLTVNNPAEENNTKCRIFFDGNGAIDEFVSFNIDQGVMGSFATVSVDLSANANWTGAVTNIGFRVRSTGSNPVVPGTNGIIEIDRILFSDSATLSAQAITKDDASLKLYPNPVRDILNISASGRSISKIEVYSLLGKKVIESASSFINVSSLNYGVYVAKIYGDNNQISTKRFVKE